MKKGLPMTWADFDPNVTLGGPTLALAPLRDIDIPALTEAAADPVTWADHPAADRWKSEVFGPYAAFLLTSGGTLVIRDRARDTVIGCSRYYASPERPDEISIGFTFLHHTYWGGATNRELKALMLGHAFTVRDAVWFHIAPGNKRSQKATGRLGARYVETITETLAGSPSEWQVWRLAKSDWTAQV
jgi:RimJ/RimL family protein N-acetyltransferase